MLFPQYEFTWAVLCLIQMPNPIIHFIISTLTAPYRFCVGRGTVREIIFQPASGIGGRGVLSPRCCSRFASPSCSLALSALRKPRPIYILMTSVLWLVASGWLPKCETSRHGAQENFWSLFRTAAQHEQEHQRFQGQGQLHPDEQKLVEHTPQGDLFLGLALLQHVKHLGVKMGNVSSDETSAWPFGEDTAYGLGQMSCPLSSCVARHR
mmetsp:Transcript_10493/g.16100  ORF Transcript_10493/g.16100 Transcript_10493/m.16100 type:complete len:209 (+) Transcript_10493:162-788(+)